MYYVLFMNKDCAVFVDVGADDDDASSAADDDDDGDDNDDDDDDDSKSRQNKLHSVHARPCII